jgi:hypothetical protein
MARRGKFIPLSEAETMPGLPVPGVDPYKVVLGIIQPDGERVLVFDKDVVSISGVWDLPMMGGERLDVEHRYQQLTNGPEVTLTNIDGTFVQGSDAALCQLQANFADMEGYATENLEKPWFHRNNFYPAGGLPEDGVLVIRTGELARFQSKLAEEQGKGRGTSELLPPRAETTYLTIIGALLELVRTPRPGRDSDAAVIRELIDNYADKPGISKTTLEAKFAHARRSLKA